MKCIILVAILSFLTTVLAIDWSKVIVDDPYIEPKGFHEIENEQESSVRISKGKPAKSKQFPYQVGLSMTHIPDVVYTWCGGSLISDRYVLTAAHCIYGRKYELLSNGSVIRHNYEYTWAWELTAHIGGYDLEKEDEFQKIYVPANPNFIMHEEYDPILFYNDIALIHLPEPAILNDFSNIINLPPANIGDLAGETLLSSGWGLDFNQNSPTVLQYATFEILTEEKCKESFDFINHNKQLCINAENKKNTCSGDSGGPNVYKSGNGLQYVVGITSFTSGLGCLSGYPSVFSRVSYYLDWIAEKTNNTIH